MLGAIQSVIQVRLAFARSLSLKYQQSLHKLKSPCLPRSVEPHIPINYFATHATRYKPVCSLTSKLSDKISDFILRHQHLLDEGSTHVYLRLNYCNCCGQDAVGIRLWRASP